MNWKFWKKIGLRFLVLNLILWSVLGISIALVIDPPGNYKYADTDWDDLSYEPAYNKTEWNILLDSHSHTFYSDGSLTPRQNLLWHMSLGFNAMVLTDHNSFKGVEEIRQIARTEYNDTIKVLIGIEWTTDRIHLNFILPPDTSAVEYEQLVTHKNYAYTPTDQEIQEVIADVHSHGGLVIVNHYSWSGYTQGVPAREDLRDWDVDYFEVINENHYDNESYYFALDNGLGMIAGTDMHNPEPVYSWTTLNVSEFTEQAIFDELEARNTGFIFTGIPSPYDIEHGVNPIYVLTYPLIKLGEMFEGMYKSESFGAMLAVFFMYIYGGYALLEVLNYFVPKGIKKIRRKDQ